MPNEPVLCPACGRAMQALRVHGIELDRCGGCHGVWFDAGEVEQVSGRTVAPAPVGADAPQVCPRCQRILRVGDLDRLHVASCGGCRGVFIDAVEVDRLRLDLPSRSDALPAVRPEEVTYACSECGERHTLEDVWFEPGLLLCVACARAKSPQARPRRADDLHWSDTLEGTSWLLDMLIHVLWL